MLCFALRTYLMVGFIVVLTACGGGGGGGGSSGPTTYSLGGSIAGLTGSGLVLSSGGQTVSPASSATSFTFPTKLATGSSYEVSVSTNPIGLKCSLSNASGTVNTNNITSIAVACESVESILYSFAGGTTYGAEPYDDLTLGSDGNFYGMTADGGNLNRGVVFKLTPSGDQTVLHSFGSVANDGNRPIGSLVQASDGNFYGVTLFGGVYGSGTVVKLTPSGLVTVLYSFLNNAADGTAPIGKLIQGADGNLYGTTSGGGNHAAGTVFKITLTGRESVIYSFGSSANDGAMSALAAYSRGLTLGNDGNFYGVTYSGGSQSAGTVFKISPTGTETVLHSFSGNLTDGYGPVGRLTLGNDGNFYGMTSGGGANHSGTVFKITPDGTETILYSFAGGTGDGSSPVSGSLVLGNDGNFYGMTSGGGAHSNNNGYGVVFRITPTGTETVLYSFAGYPNDGGSPQGSLVQGNDGCLYGMTYGGGNRGDGAFFKVSTAGAEAMLFAFANGASDGSNPSGALAQDPDGNLYGLTYIGGANAGGTVYKATTNNTVTTLYSFGQGLSDGTQPSGALVFSADTYLYGVTGFGGANYGTVFSIALDGTKTTLHDFVGTDGVRPGFGLIEGYDGYLYGVTQSNCCAFKITPSGTQTVLHSFNGGSTDGDVATGKLLRASDGNLYGVTSGGGSYSAGTIYKIVQDGTETLLYSFGGIANGGSHPVGNLIQGSDGFLYGATSLGGTNGMGAIFKIALAGGAETLLHSFSGGDKDGAGPQAGLILGRDGNFYGVTTYGGSYNSGTVFKVATNGTLSLLYAFGANSNDGISPRDELIQRNDGNLYGVTSDGGNYRGGTLFKITIQ